MSEKIIKAAVKPGQKVVKEDIYDATAKAGQIVEMAREESAALLAEAKREAEELREAARQKGLEEGLAQWNAAVQEAIEARQRYLDECEREVIRLAVSIAGKILGQRLETDPETVVLIVREALRGIREERNLTIKVNAGELAAVSARVRELEEGVPGDCRVRVVAGNAVEPGGCIVETELGTIDARIETQLRCLEHVLLHGAGRGH